MRVVPTFCPHFGVPLVRGRDHSRRRIELIQGVKCGSVHWCSRAGGFESLALRHTKKGTLMGALFCMAESEDKIRTRAAGRPVRKIRLRGD
jgi:hypothetical protein